MAELVKQAGFSQARLAHDVDESALAGDGLFQLHLERRQLAFPPDVGGEAPRLGRLEAGFHL